MTTTETIVRTAAARAVGAIGLAGVGLVHLLDAPGKLSETPYMFWMYLALIVASIAVGGELLRTGSRRAWAAAGALAGSAIVGYVLTRTTGLPQDHGDIGNWTEPLGLASLWIEGGIVLLAAVVLTATAPVARRLAAPTAAARAPRPS